MTNEKEIISLAEALKLLPEGDTIHTFRQSGRLIVGADWERNELIEALTHAPEIQITGQQAQKMNHGLGIKDNMGYLFIKTKKQEDLK